MGEKSKYDYIAEARRIMASFDRNTQDVVFGKLAFLPEEQFASIGALYWCCGNTSQSICELAKLRQLWDMQVLLRVVVNATAKFCYLLTPDETKRASRIKEYVDLATKGDHASMEQPLKALFEIGAYGSGARLDFATREFKQKNNLLKTSNGEGSVVKEARNHLDYWNLSRVLKDEYWYWKEMYASFDFEYASANKIVHLNYTGCAEVMRRIYAMQTGSYSIDDDDATISRMLFSLCALCRARCELVYSVAKVDPTPIRGILTTTDPFVRYTDEMCEKAADKVMASGTRLPEVESV